MNCNIYALRRALCEFLFKVHGMHRLLDVGPRLAFIAGLIWAAFYVSSPQFWQHPMLQTESHQRQPASQSGAFVLNEARVESTGPGRVYLDLDPDAKAYFDDETSERSPGYHYGETLQLTPGNHAVTVYKPGFPPVTAAITIYANSVTMLSGRLLAP